MTVTIDLPENVEQQLAAASGGDLSRAALEALVAEAYRTEVISTGEVARLLGLSIDQANAFLGSRKLYPKYSVEELEADVFELERLLAKRERSG